MEPMRPVDVGRQDPPKRWWQRWGSHICGAITLLVIVVLKAAVGLSLWGAVLIGVALAGCWTAIETVATRRLRAASAAPATAPHEGARRTGG